MLILLTVCHTFHIFYLSLTDFQHIPGPVTLERLERLERLESPGKCHRKIPGLSRFSRTPTKPDARVALTNGLNN